MLTSRAQRRAVVLSGGAKQSCRRCRRIMARCDIGHVQTAHSTGSPCKPHIERNRISVVSSRQNPRDVTSESHGPQVANLAALPVLLGHSPLGPVRPGAVGSVVAGSMTADPAAVDPAAARSVAALDRGARLAGRADARIWSIGASVATLSNAAASMATRRG